MVKRKMSSWMKLSLNRDRRLPRLIMYNMYICAMEIEKACTCVLKCWVGVAEFCQCMLSCCLVPLQKTGTLVRNWNPSY